MNVGLRSPSRVLGTQPVGDWTHKPGGRLPLLPARPAVTPPQPLDLGPMYATDRQTDVRRASSLNAPTLGAGHNNGGGGDDDSNNNHNQPHSITAYWPVPNYTARWQRHMWVNNLPVSAAGGCRTCDLQRPIGWNVQQDMIGHISAHCYHHCRLQCAEESSPITKVFSFSSPIYRICPHILPSSYFLSKYLTRLTPFNFTLHFLTNSFVIAL